MEVIIVRYIIIKILIMNKYDNLIIYAYVSDSKALVY